MKDISVLGFTRETAPEKIDGVQYYRAYLPLREVNQHDNGIKTQLAGGKALVGVSDEALGGRDVYTMCRMYRENCDEFLAGVHRQGGVLVLDSDDDLTEAFKLVSGRGREFKRALGIVDHVTVSTQPLADLFGQYTQKPPVVLKNCVDTEWMSGLADKAKRLVGGLTIGFSGSPTHWGDWYLPAVPFSRILRDHDVIGVLHGEHPRYLGFAAQDSKLVRFGGVPFAIYPVLLRQFDILLCAVDSRDEFNAGKSAVKALEAMSAGAVPVCSQFKPYMDLADAGAPVVIVEEDSRDGWYEAMATLITDEERHRDLRARGLPWVRENRDMCVSGYKQWEEFLRSIVE